jgi:outer membrane lipoprotein-sorting protein
MKTGKAWTILLGGLLTVAGIAAPAATDAQAILQKVADTYTNLKSYHFEGTTVAETKAGTTDSSSETGFSVAMSPPNKLRVEFRYANAGSWVRVSDGKTTMRYRSLTKEMKKDPASPDDLDMGRATPISTNHRTAAGVNNATLLPEESLQVNGASVPCYVVEVEYNTASARPGMEPLPTRYWIDKARDIVLKQVTGTRSTKQDASHATQNTRTTTFTVASVNENVPDTLFAFNPK